MARGRPKGSKNRPKNDAGGAPAGEARRNFDELDDDQRHSLTRQHLKRRKELVELEKTAKANRLNYDKVIKADLGANGLKDIKGLEEMEGDENAEQKIKAEFERQLRLARWAGLEIGHTIDMFADVPQRSLRERAFDEGKRAGFNGEPPKAPGNYSPASDGEQGWMEGWHRGQALLAEKSIKPTTDPGIINGGEKPANPDEFDKDSADPWPDETQAAENKAKNEAGGEASTTVN